MPHGATAHKASASHRLSIASALSLRSSVRDALTFASALSLRSSVRHALSRVGSLHVAVEQHEGENDDVGHCNARDLLRRHHELEARARASDHAVHGPAEPAEDEEYPLVTARNTKDPYD